jgi:secreted trypsin-like serine protease
MPFLRTLLLALLAGALIFTPSAHAIVGGNDAEPGEYPYVAHVTIDKMFGCTGTLVAPTWVVTAGHCSSLSGVAVATPIGQPGQLIDVRLNSLKAHEGEGQAAKVKRVVVHPDYVFTNDPSYDVALLELSAPVDLPTVKIAGADEASLWSPGTMATIAGFGVTESGGDSPSVLQEAQVPIVDDATTAEAYDSFESLTQIGAGFPQGGVDTCQGDSGGPLLVPGPSGALRLVGDTSYGNGCAEPGYPGIYGRVADTTLREWVRGIAPEAVAGSAPSAAEASAPDEAPARRSLFTLR